jgi:hypothetical protein
MSIRIYIYLIIVQKIRSFFSCYPKNLTRNYILRVKAELFSLPLFAMSSVHSGTVLRLFLKIKDNFLWLNRGIRYFTDERFEHYVAHTFHELDTANNKVPATAYSSTGYLIFELPYHSGDIHEHAA